VGIAEAYKIDKIDNPSLGEIMRHVLVMILSLSGLLAGSADASGVLERESLRGLAGVVVVVEDIGPDVKKDGLSVEAIRTAAELILRSSGIRVLTEDDNRPGLSAAILEINATPVKSRALSVYGVNVTGVVIQQVIVSNPTEMATPAITWGKSYTGVVSSKSVKARVIGDVESIAKEFANDFLSVNPR